MPIKVSFFDMAHDQAPGEADRRNGPQRSKKAGHGRETCGERSDVRSRRCCHHIRLLAVTHYRRRELEGLPRRLTSASGRGANVGSCQAPSRANSPARLLRRLFFDPRGCVRAADQALRPDSLRGRYRIGLALYSDEGAQPAGFLTQPLQRLPEVPPPPSICWPISAMAR
jgi:hypothetical protein